MVGHFSDGEAGNLPRWTLLFAREPDSEVDVDLDEPGSASPSSSPTAPAPRKPPRVRILMLIVLLLILAGGAYVAMDPAKVMQLLGEESVPAPSARTMPTNRPPTVARTPPTRSVESEGPEMSASPDAVPAPLFAEGQRVAIAPQVASAMTPPSLTQDAAGTSPGPAVRPTSALLVLDAELHQNGWIYLVRTDDGTKGWIPEKQLVAHQ